MTFRTFPWAWTLVVFVLLGAGIPALIFTVDALRYIRADVTPPIDELREPRLIDLETGLVTNSVYAGQWVRIERSVCVRRALKGVIKRRLVNASVTTFEPVPIPPLLPGGCLPGDPGQLLQTVMEIPPDKLASGYYRLLADVEQRVGERPITYGLRDMGLTISRNPTIERLKLEIAAAKKEATDVRRRLDALEKGLELVYGRIRIPPPPRTHDTKPH